MVLVSRLSFAAAAAAVFFCPSAGGVFHGNGAVFPRKISPPSTFTYPTPLSSPGVAAVPSSGFFVWQQQHDKVLAVYPDTTIFYRATVAKGTPIMDGNSNSKVILAFWVFCQC